MARKLTVLIPCRNEANNIAACIESVRGIADEILVADSLSTDNTLDIVRRTGICRIIEREFVDHANFKNWAIPQANHPWILVVDADERLSEGLAAEIREVLERDDPSLNAYRVRFETFFLNDPIRHCGWNHSTVIRLFRRDACRYGSARVHERLDVKPDKVGMLRGKFLHYTCSSLAQWTEKQNRYTTLWAEDKHAAGRRTSWGGIFFRPPLRFLQLYLFKGGFIDGTAGLVVCLSSMFYTFLKYAKLWQLNRAPATREPPAVLQPS
jgi:(heptosyl)LPS beta-1,4-glucosyltransferase